MAKVGETFGVPTVKPRIRVGQESTIAEALYQNYKRIQKDYKRIQTEGICSESSCHILCAIPTFGAKPVADRNAILEDLIANLRYEDLRYIATGLERYLSPELSFEECVSREVPSVVPSPRRAPGTSG